MKSVARTSPIEFFNQVKTEARKIIWPSGRETMMTTLMVILMTGTLAIFFTAVDSLFSWIVKMLLGLASGQ
jgi:preprotein translocase subunit SecE